MKKETKKVAPKAKADKDKTPVKDKYVKAKEAK